MVLMETLTICPTIDHEEALVRVKQAIKGEEGCPLKREWMIIEIAREVQIERGTSIVPFPVRFLHEVAYLEYPGDGKALIPNDVW